MRRSIVLAALAAVVLSAGCRRPQEFDLVGQVLSVRPDRLEITIRHQDIRGFMPGMTMPFKVRDVRLIDGYATGDLVKARLVVEETEAHLTALERTGHAPVAEIPADAVPAVDILEPGAAVPDAHLVDQGGVSHRLADWRGSIVAVTFIYTRCPLPDFCPRMNRHFSTVQTAIRNDARLRGQVQLLSISFDPAFDTPAVLAAHARQTGADPAVWNFLTGTDGEIGRLAGRFGVSIIREGDPTEIVHNLRTVVIGRDGRLVTILRGNEWTSDELMTALRSAL